VLDGDDRPVKTVEGIREALLARGIVFTNGDKPGCYFDKDKVSTQT
jgi:hypothetical protein